MQPPLIRLTGANSPFVCRFHPREHAASLRAGLGRLQRLGITSRQAPLHKINSLHPMVILMGYDVK
jgi:hypothetical protein